MSQLLYLYIIDVNWKKSQTGLHEIEVHIITRKYVTLTKQWVWKREDTRWLKKRGLVFSCHNGNIQIFGG